MIRVANATVRTDSFFFFSGVSFSEEKDLFYFINQI